MSMDRRQFLRRALATGVVAIGVTAVAGQTGQAATPSRTATDLGSTESWLLGTARRALA